MRGLTHWVERPQNLVNRPQSQHSRNTTLYNAIICRSLTDVLVWCMSWQTRHLSHCILHFLVYSCRCKCVTKPTVIIFGCPKSHHFCDWYVAATAARLIWLPKMGFARNKTLFAEFAFFKCHVEYLVEERCINLHHKKMFSMNPLRVAVSLFQGTLTNCSRFLFFWRGWDNKKMASPSFLAKLSGPHDLGAKHEYSTSYDLNSWSGEDVYAIFVCFKPGIGDSGFDRSNGAVGNCTVLFPTLNSASPQLL